MQNRWSSFQDDPQRQSCLNQIHKKLGYVFHSTTYFYFLLEKLKAIGFHGFLNKIWKRPGSPLWKR